MSAVIKNRHPPPWKQGKPSLNAQRWDQWIVRTEDRKHPMRDFFNLVSPNQHPCRPNRLNHAAYEPYRVREMAAGRRAIKVFNKIIAHGFGIASDTADELIH